MNTQICVIIPTLNPDDKLIPYIEELLQNGVSRMSGYRILNGETDRVKGHGLEYLDG